MRENIEYLVKVVGDTAGLKKVTRDMEQSERVSRKYSRNLSKDAKFVSGSVDTAYTKSGRKVRTFTGQFESQGRRVQVVTRATGKNMGLLKDSVGAYGTGLKKTTPLVGQFTKLLSRAALVIPVWLLLRSVFMGVMGTIKGVVTEFLALEKGMRKVMAVSSATAQTQDKIYKDLETAARRYFTTTSKGFKDITEAMYQLGTAGRSTEEILEGFEHVLNLAIGTFGDVATAGKTVAGILNVFEEDLKRFGSTADQIRYISDLLAFSWQNNQIELNEISTAMSYLASVGNLLDLSLEELIVSQSVMNNAMLRGGKGARQLARALTQVAKAPEKLKALGVVFDETKPLNFADVMEQLIVLYGDQQGNLVHLKELTDVFGIRGIRAIDAVMGQWDKWKEQIKSVGGDIEKLSEKLKESAELTYPDLIKKAFRQLIISQDIAGEMSWHKKLLKDITNENDNINKIVGQVMNNWGKVGDQIKISQEEAKFLVKTLLFLGRPKFATQLVEQFQLSADILEKMPVEFLFPSVEKAGESMLLAILDIQKNITREVNRQTEEAKEQNKVILKLNAGKKESLDRELLLGKAKASQTFTTKELLNLEKKLIKNSQFSIGQYDQIVKLRQLENKILIDTVKQQVQTRSTLVDSQIKILELEGLSKVEAILARIELEKKLGIEKNSVDLLKQQLELVEAIKIEQKISKEERLDALKQEILKQTKLQRPSYQARLERQEEALIKRAEKLGIDVEQFLKVPELEFQMALLGETISVDLPNDLKRILTDPLEKGMFHLASVIESLADQLVPERFFIKPPVAYAPIQPTVAEKEARKVDVQVGDIIVQVTGKGAIADIKAQIAEEILKPNSEIDKALNEKIDKF